MLTAASGEKSHCDPYERVVTATISCFTLPILKHVINVWVENDHERRYRKLTKERNLQICVCSSSQFSRTRTPQILTSGRSFFFFDYNCGCFASVSWVLCCPQLVNGERTFLPPLECSSIFTFIYFYTRLFLSSERGGLAAACPAVLGLGSSWTQWTGWVARSSKGHIETNNHSLSHSCLRTILSFHLPVHA